MNRRTATYTLLALCSAMLPWTFASEMNPAETFEQLKKLQGEWKGTAADGRTEKVTYRLIASDSVLMEAWVLGSGREALTVYHRDGDDLIATHYCPRGNQPRLKLKSASTKSGFVFEFVSATNLLDPEASHQHRFEIRMDGPDSFSREEMYLAKGTPSSAKVTYSRADQVSK